MIKPYFNKVLFLFSGLAMSEYIVKVASQSTLVNPGENYMAYCNIPGQGALDIISNLKVKWFHNGQPLTSLCEFLSTELAQRYSCKVLSPQQNNISLELTISSKCEITLDFFIRSDFTLGNERV